MEIAIAEHFQSLSEIRLVSEHSNFASRANRSELKMEVVCKESNDVKFLKNFKACKKSFVVEPYDYFLPDNGGKVFGEIMDFQARKDDIFVVTFVKAGTAWIQEIVYLLNIGVDLEKANKTLRADDFPYLELHVWPLLEQLPNPLETLKTYPSPRLIKTHLPYVLMPPTAIERKCKMIYVARNMKDVITSYYHFVQKMNTTKYRGDFRSFVELFMEDKVPYCPYIDHVEDFWNRRHESNILFITYEDMKKDLQSVVEKVAQFLGKTVSKEQMAKLLDHCSFQKMKVNPACNKSQYTSTNSAQEDFQYLRKAWRHMPFPVSRWPLSSLH